MTDPIFSGESEPLSDFGSQFLRVCTVAGCGSQAELASFLGVGRAAVTEAKRRKSIPSTWLMALREKKGVRPDWILSGEGPVYLEASWDLPHVVCITHVRPPENCPTRDLVTELVRRALLGPDPEAMRRHAAASWYMEMKE